MKCAVLLREIIAPRHGQKSLRLRDSGKGLGLPEETADTRTAVEHDIKGRHRTVQARGHAAAF